MGVMRHLGMIEGRPEPSKRVLRIGDYWRVGPRVGGYLEPVIGLDRQFTEFEKDELMARVVSPFTFEVVDKDKLRADHDNKNQSPYAVCDGMIERVIILCRAGGDEKAAVKSKITGFQCGHGKPRSLALDKGILRYRNNLDEANFDDWAKPALEKKL